MNFSTYSPIFWNLQALKITTSTNFWRWVGVAVDLVYTWKNWGKGQVLSKILVISQHAMRSRCWKQREGSNALEQKAISTLGKRIWTKKVISKLEQGLNFIMMVEVWFFDDNFLKNHNGKKGYFCCFCLMLKWSFFVVVQAQKVIFGKKCYVSYVYWISKFKGHPISCSQLTAKAIFAQLRKLQSFEAWESCVAGVSQHGSRWVNYMWLTKHSIIFAFDEGAY